MSAQSAVSGKKDAMYLVHSLICLAIMFGFGQLPPMEPLTPLGMNLIGIFLQLADGVSVGRMERQSDHRLNGA